MHDVRVVLLVAALAAVALTFARATPLRSAIGVAAFCVASMWAGGLAGERPGAYLADRYGGAGGPAGAFEAFRSSTFARVVVVGLPAGAATLIRPAIDAYDAEPGTACSIARATGAGLLLALPVGAPGLTCGRVVLEDRTSALVAPR